LIVQLPAATDLWSNNSFSRYPLRDVSLLALLFFNRPTESSVTYFPPGALLVNSMNQLTPLGMTVSSELTSFTLNSNLDRLANQTSESEQGFPLVSIQRWDAIALCVNIMLS
jgi:hypothetical protein